MKLWKVHFEYLEEGYIPNIVAPDEDAAIEGANLMLADQGMKAKILRVEDQTKTKEKETIN